MTDPYVVRSDIGPLWKVCERATGRVLCVCFSRRLAYIVRRHLSEVLS
jgi:hypothetical protein